MKKRLFTLTLCLLTALMMLAGCGGGDSSSQPRPAASTATPEPSRSSSMKVTVTNDSSYTFNELYVSSTASSSWGTDHLGSTSILKKNGSFDISLEVYDFDNYDIRVVDEDDDIYIFKYVTLQNGTEVVIYFDNGLMADIYHADGTSEVITGTFESGSEGGDDYVEDDYVDDTPAVVDGYTSNGAFSFNVYNESSYDIYALYIGVLNASSEHDIDLLPAILPAGDSTTVSGGASRGDWENTEWTLYVKDVDGDTSASFDVFNPWTLSYVDIYWDSSNGGYVCDFYY
ncbi:hypothetical protein LJC60_00750 [Ruminococcaceae bacterium OttesenSCG-928-D13]|nr:hypothetical protein [Ruminococcaceae bacterium OttesenSCG-928-D13]